MSLEKIPPLSPTGPKSLDPRVLFERPLITGASVSADAGTESPGKRLGLRHTSPANIRTLARSGTPGHLVVKDLVNTSLSDRTIIVAMDLFFWDSTLPSSAATRMAIADFMKKVDEHQLPLVLGNIPDLLPGRQRLRPELNSLIEESCKSRANCFLLDLNKLHISIMADGYLEFRGRRYTFRELVPDGLHLSAVASDFLAEKILETLRP